MRLPHTLVTFPTAATNHSADDPKEIFQCDVVGCDQKFVRADLLARHRKRHSTSYVPRNRAPSFASTADGSPVASRATMLSPSGATETRSVYAVPHDAAILLSSPASTHPSQPLAVGSSSSRISQAPTWSATIPEMSASVNAAPPKAGYYHRPAQSLPQQGLAFNSAVQFPPEDMSRTENFGMWLFDPFNAELSVAHLPFVEGGLESTFNSNIHYDYESQSLTSSRSQLETPPQLAESDELLRDYRRDVILQYLERFRQNNARSGQLAASLLRDAGGDLPGLSLDNMRDCIREYWQYVAPRMPIVHQPTFNCNRGSIFLLMLIIALGAASLRGHDTTDQYSDCGVLAEVIIDGVRWEILTQDDASPPVSLPVAQSLLLLEFYEKMYSSRKFHERAHIFHTATLTLLRRGSPLIGRSGTESPPEEHPAAESSQGVATDARTQWIQWADTEAMHRVVFAAFMMDILHAAMFGHTADMAPHEIRLPLPCDDTLWTAPTPEIARQHESNLRMYGITGLPFLDGLKKALHGKPVKTASFGRMIILSGLLSVGWHLSHRETHLKSLDLTAPSTESQENWMQIVLKAFDRWKEDIDAVQGAEGSPSIADQGIQRSSLNGPIQSAAVLYHLAHICLHVDIVDCQVYAGAKRLLGRKVSARDRANVVSRTESWAHLPSTRHAVLHAFKLLHRVLVDPRRSSTTSENVRIKQEYHSSSVNLPPVEAQTYSCRNEPDPHRPWIMYYAALCIWSYVMALRQTHHGHGDSQAHSDHPATSRHPAHQQHNTAHWAARPAPPVNYGRVVAYLTDVSSLADLKESDASTLTEGLPDLLDTLHSVLAEAHSELLREAHQRLKVCKDILLSAPG